MPYLSKKTKLKPIFFFITILCLFFICGINGCDHYIVGIVPVYTEENSYQPNLSYRERLNIQDGYYEAIRQSRRLTQVVFPLYLHVDRFSKKGPLRPNDAYKHNVREFYKNYYFKGDGINRQLYLNFMQANRINLLVMSDYYTTSSNALTVHLKVIKRDRGGSEDSLSWREKDFEVENFKDYEKLMQKSRDKLAHIMDQFDHVN